MGAGNLRHLGMIQTSGSWRRFFWAWFLARLPKARP